MGSKRVTHGTEQQQNKYFPRSVSQGNRDKSKSKQMGPNQTYKLLHSKGNSKTKQKEILQTGRKYLQMMQPTRAQFPKYANSSCSAITDKTDNPTQSNNGQKN